MVSSNNANSTKWHIKKGRSFSQLSSGAGNVHSGPGTPLVLSSTYPHNSSGLPHLADSGCPYVRSCPAISAVCDILCLVAINHCPPKNSPVRNVHTSGGPIWSSLAALPRNIQISYLWTLQLYGSMTLKREREKTIGKESQKNLWYTFLGTNEQWGCFAILWDGLLSIHASVALKIHQDGDGDRDTNSRTRMKYYLPTFCWSYGPPMPMLSPWIRHSGPDRSPTVPLLPSHPLAPQHSIKMRSERRRELGKNERRTSLACLVDVMCLPCHPFAYSSPPSFSVSLLCSSSVDTHDSKSYSVASPMPCLFPWCSVWKHHQKPPCPAPR